MVPIASIYLLLSLALGAGWIAADLRAQSYRRSAREFVLVALAWPAVLALVVGLMLFGKSTKDEGTS